MSERLKALADAGVSIWLDDLSRERIETGNLADLVKDSSVVGRHHQPDDLRRGPRRRRAVRRPGARARRGGHRRRRGDLRDHHRPTSATPATCSRTTYDATDGVDGRVSIEVAPGLAHDDRGDHRVGQGAVGRGRPAEPVHQDPGHHRGRARRSPTCSREGISVNVTLIFGLDRYDAVMDAYLDGPRAGQGQRPATCPRSTRSRRSSSPASTPRSTSGSRRSATAQARQPEGHGRRSPTPGWPTRPTRRSSPATASRRSRPPAPTPQRPLWASTGVKDPDYRDTMYVTDLVGRQHRQHDAGEDHAGLRRPRRGRRRPGHRPSTPRPSRSWTTWPRLGIDYDDVIAGARGRGRRQVRDVVGRARRDRQAASSTGAGREQ